jgi:hypothetical protein
LTRDKVKLRMATVTQQSDAFKLHPLPYQLALRDFLRDEEREIWNWYAAHSVGPEHAEAVRLELLKSTYRIEQDAQPELYATAAEAAQRLRLDVPVTIYRSQNADRLNASLAYLPREAHIILHGSVDTALKPPELEALFAHELGHLVLWQAERGEMLLVDQILAALLHDRARISAQRSSARLFWLYNEIFCDRAALAVARNPLIVIATLVKLETETPDVSAESYLRQAQEIFSRTTPQTAEITHPEAFIRARAVQLWHDNDPQAEAEIERMIEGPLSLGKLDLLGQRKVEAMTKSLIDALLAERWMQTDHVLSHARLFFDDYEVPLQASTRTSAAPFQFDNASLLARLAEGDSSLHSYFSFVLLDFVTVDRDLEELPLAWALCLSEALGIQESFTQIAKRELSLKKKQLEKIEAAKDEMLSKVRGEATQTP